MRSCLPLVVKSYFKRPQKWWKMKAKCRNWSHHQSFRSLVYIKINDAKSIENAKKNSLCHFFGGQQKYLQEDRRQTEKSLYWKKNSGISNRKNVKIEKTREVKYFNNFTKFCFSYKKLTGKKTFHYSPISKFKSTDVIHWLIEDERFTIGTKYSISKS